MALYGHGQEKHGAAVPMCGQSAPVGDGWCVLPKDHPPGHESLLDPTIWP